MKVTVVNVPQRSGAWFEARLGRLTASRAGDVVARIKTGEAAARRDYRMQLVCERLTGMAQDSDFQSAAMLRGIEMEAAAVAAYEAETGQLVREVGFYAVDELEAGCSPDGIINDGEGVLEVKCPKSATHLQYLRDGKLPSRYVAQVTCALWVTGAKWADFVSFDDRFPLPLQFLRVRVERDEAAIVAFDEAARAFLAEVDRDEAELRQVLAEAA